MSSNKTFGNDSTTFFKNRVLNEHHWLLFAFYICLAFGVAINFIYVCALIKNKKNGVLWIILQLALVDIALCYIAVTEVLNLDMKSWYFVQELCPVFKGMEIFLNTVTIYLLICFNFHVISLSNLHDIHLKQSNKNPLTSCRNDDSNECLVTKQENRQVTIDYRKRKDDISISFPTIFIWIVSASLSIPNFTLSSTIRNKENSTICAVIDIYYGQILESSLVTFKTIVPLVFFLLTLILLWVKLMQTSDVEIDNVLSKKICDIRRFMLLAISLSIVYLVTSLQRHIIHCIHVVLSFQDKSLLNSLKTPPLNNNFTGSLLTIYLSMLHYSSPTFRGILYIAIIPKFIDFVIRFFKCKKKK